MKASLLRDNFSYNDISRYLYSVLARIKHYEIIKEVSVERISIESIVHLSRYATYARKERGEKIAKAIIEAGGIIYEPSIIYNENRYRIVFPPVIERKKNKHYLMDGTHRLLAAKEMGLTMADLLIISDENLPDLPCTHSSWDIIKIKNKQRQIQEVLLNYDRTKFRPVTTTFNSSAFIFESKKEAIEHIENNLLSIR